MTNSLSRNIYWSHTDDISLSVIVTQLLISIAAGLFISVMAADKLISVLVEALVQAAYQGYINLVARLLGEVIYATI